MVGSSFSDVEYVVRKIAQTAVDQEKYFGDLDAVVGDGDFGYSLARGFGAVLAQWDTIPRSDIGTFLTGIAVLITGSIGGTSGPIWGTAFMRAGIIAGPRQDVDGPIVLSMLRSAIDGIKARGNAELGDKTLLDALIPAADAIENGLAEAESSESLARRFATVARERAESTKELQAKRGRASYVGERSIGTLDAGAVAVAVMAEQIADGWSYHRNTAGPSERNQS